ncbi:xanthine dehydrogenase/oxidase [Acrasis kona]|uniref:Xanthine dehydrogenase/oxidase n=1 Tax=Acrasis kona TaxID=1008807 RepID=A0AAW2Z2V9_9EUKA
MSTRQEHQKTMIKNPPSNTIHFYVNGEAHTVANPHPDASLIEYLRSTGLTGTKLGCNEGGCGACTIMLSHYDHDNKKIVNRSVNACLAPLCSVDACAIITVEGIGNTKGMLHMVQERVANFNGSQCGFCTPGIIMSLYTLLRNNPYPTEHEIEHSLDGNLCRCTGYRPILSAAKTFICPSSGKPCNCSGDSKHNKDEPQFEDGDVFDLRGKKHPLFPAALKQYDPRSRDVIIENEQDGIKWYRPNSLEKLLEYKREVLEQNMNTILDNERVQENNKQPGAIRSPLRALPVQIRMIVGNSEVAIETRQKAQVYQSYVQPTTIPELCAIKPSQEGIEVGASVTLGKLTDYLQEEIRKVGKDHYSMRAYISILDQLRYFASTPIRNACSLGGNIMTASPISDLNPLWVALGCTANILDIDNNSRTVPMDQFFLSYRTVAVDPHREILHSLFIPKTQSAMEFARPYKQARRREDDIAIVNAGMKAVLTTVDSQTMIESFHMAFGGMAVCTISAKRTQDFLRNKPLTDDTFQQAIPFLIQDLPLSQEAPGGMIEYRRSLTLSFFFKFFQYLKFETIIDPHHQKQVDTSAITPLHRTYPTGTQDWDKTNIRGTSVGKDEKHMSAHLQVTGEAKYLDDVPKQSNEVHACFVLSQKPHAKVTNVDISVAKTIPGFVYYADHTDVEALGGSNRVGAIIHDEDLFVTDKCTSVGQIIGVVCATSLRIARQCVKLIRIEYEELSPVILSIKDAIEHSSYQGDNHHVTRFAQPDVTTMDELFTKYTNDPDHVLVEGDFFMGGQEHFYLEGHACLVIPGEQDELTVISSTQALTHTQCCVSEVTNVPTHKIVCKAKRIGGGFGGKETRGMLYAAAASVCARRLNQPVRLVLDRDVDMGMSGQRHPFMTKYRSLINKKDKKIFAIQVTMYSNAGFSLDLSQSVMDRSILSFDNCYHVPNVDVIGKVCLTNLPSHTAFRGFGGPQGMMAMEHIIEHMSFALDVDPIALRRANLYDESNHFTPYGQIVDYERLHRLWDQIMIKSDHQNRMESIQQYNSSNRFKKKAMCMVPTKFGISFTASFLNQGGALVHIYHSDGTVLVSHGGVEMGQGLHTKVAQVAASVLGVPLHKVFIAETSTDKVPNTSATAASVGSDLYGMAVQNACEQLKSRLDRFQSSRNVNYASWEELIDAAYHYTVNLSAQGFYKTPDLHLNWDKGRGTPFSYYTYGTACSEIEIDTLTGDFNILRTDIVMDVGDSINPAIDIGQIEGAFTQGVGLFTIEELIWGDADHKWVRPGHYFTRGPGAYKIPSFNDVPVEFNVHLLKNAPNALAVYRSKAIGEPPLFLGCTVFYGIKHAIQAARRDHGVNEYFCLDSPATPERIRMTCCDDLTKRFTANWPMKNQLIDDRLRDLDVSDQELDNMKHVQYRANGSY